jgi:hypothetical protein
MIIHQCISGFTQNVHQIHGILKLSERMRRPESGVVDCCHRRLYFNRWNDDWKKIAEHYWNVADLHLESLTICVYAYSWGAGWGAMQLARHLKRFEMKVRVMVLCDPVYRNPHWYLKWLSLVHRDSSFSPVIRVPDNVREVFHFHQRVNVPSGHKLVGTGETLIRPPIELRRIHQKMDDSWEFHGLSLSIAKKVNSRLSLDDAHYTDVSLDDMHFG